MEAVHLVKERTWISDVINLRTFLEFWIRKLKGTFVVGDKISTMKDFCNKMDVKCQNSFNKTYGPENFDCEFEQEMISQNNFDIPSEVNLETLNFHKQDMEKRKLDNKYKKNITQTFTYANYPPKLTSESKSVKPNISLQEADIVLTIQIFRPISQSIRLIQRRSMLTFIVDQQMAVLGCQTLTELRKCITCVSDVTVHGDFSENPNMSQTNRASDIYKSGFFFINNTFYNDMKDPNNRDYSDVIRKWAKEPDRGIGPFQTALMEETKFIDLNIQLGYPYLYLHQGNCEHLMVFTDLRLIHPDDSHNIRDYPMFLNTFCKKAVYCMICETQVAKWLTYNNCRLPCDPYFFCDTCFRLFNYTVDGKKIGEFQAHPYFDRTALV